jgi:hypothetical protein
MRALYQHIDFVGRLAVATAAGPALTKKPAPETATRLRRLHFQCPSVQLAWQMGSY